VIGPKAIEVTEAEAPNCLWLGHESVATTQIYIHADMRMKEKALANVCSSVNSDRMVTTTPKCSYQIAFLWTSNQTSEYASLPDRPQNWLDLEQKADRPRRPLW
jgi:hypothetical protein